MKKLSWVFVLGIILWATAMVGCGSSRHDAFSWFYVRSVYNGYVVSINATDGHSVDVSKVITLGEATALADELNRAVRTERFARDGNGRVN